ncbi:hypothetical protein FRC01_013433 [Tulasnella sp. 417]|nr:hypothetical protein FRC01_013433 [Tulasnella sp. 417]
MELEIPTGEEDVRQRQWTLAQQRLTPPGGGRRISEAVNGDMVAGLRFYGTQAPVQIDHEHLLRLEDRQWLSSSLCSFYCYEVGNAYLEGDIGRSMDLVVLHCNTWSLGKPNHPGPSRLRHENAPSPLEYKFVAFPANETEDHFFLCIIAWASDLLADLNPGGPVHTTVFILNSSAHLQPSNAQKSVQNIVKHLSCGRAIREEELQTITVHFPSVPQQPNSYDCGLYPGHFLSVFLSAPDTYTAHCLGKQTIAGSLDEIWCHEDVQFARENLRDLVASAIVIRQAALDFSVDRPGLS